MAEPQDMILPMLDEMRGEMRQRFEDIERRFDKRFDEVDDRLRALEKIMRAQREAFEGESILGRYTVRGVEERPDELERKVAALEAER